MVVVIIVPHSLLTKGKTLRSSEAESRVAEAKNCAVRATWLEVLENSPAYILFKDRSNVEA